MSLSSSLLTKLQASWEAFATDLANAADDQQLVDTYNNLAKQQKVRSDTKARVIFARDTRASGSTLVAALVAGLQATDVELEDYKILTTPQLHYLVRCDNTKGTQYAYGEVSETGYYEKLSDAFKGAMAGKTSQGHVVVDCANGVGGPKLREIIKYLPDASKGGVDIKVVNDEVHKPEMLNVSVGVFHSLNVWDQRLLCKTDWRALIGFKTYRYLPNIYLPLILTDLTPQCGADYVKVNQRAPPSSKASSGERCASLDGDADRLVYYFLEGDTFRLLDGDRIATLAASFLGDLVRASGLADQISIGIVQTAYANGNSTKYVVDTLKLQVECTPTGVKYLHHAATRYDVGVYFEANGHGTVLFSDTALKAISDYQPQSPAQQTAQETLRALTELINQTVGDAISDMLLVEVILAHKSWTLANWLNTYNDLPNRLLKVEVKDRNIFKTTNAERQLVSPEGIQDAIDKLVGQYSRGRSFARASGTEDAVRVYAEAATRSEADGLAQKVAEVVKQFGS